MEKRMVIANGFINLGFYRFFALQTRCGDLPELRARLKTILSAHALRGTLLLAPEGVNAMLSGERNSIEALKELAMREFGIEKEAFKEAAVAAHSFNRLLIKVKRELIPIGDEQIRPHEKTAAYLSARTLKKWLDEKRPLVLLDARNDYEYSTGTFRGAVQLGLESSREFSAKAKAARPGLENHTIVTFCTGGIRCEKASAALLKLGLKNVYQLDGGILRYFEENGAAHFEGNCFVFDWRLAVDGELNPVARSSAQDAAFGRHLLTDTILENQDE
jgi:UPF0176 protein